VFVLVARRKSWLLVVESVVVKVVVEVVVVEPGRVI